MLYSIYVHDNIESKGATEMLLMVMLTLVALAALYFPFALKYFPEEEETNISSRV